AISRRIVSCIFCACFINARMSIEVSRRRSRASDGVHVDDLAAQSLEQRLDDRPLHRLGLQAFLAGGLGLAPPAPSGRLPPPRRPAPGIGPARPAPPARAAGSPRPAPYPRPAPRRSAALRRRRPEPRGAGARAATRGARTATRAAR